MKKTLFAVFFVSTVVVAGLVVHFFNQLNPGRSEQARHQLKLIVYTHSSFMGPFGPGPKIAKDFEPICNCTVEYVNAGGAGLLLQRLVADRGKQVDVVVGADLLSLYDLAKNIEFRPLNFPLPKLKPELEGFTFQHFAPYDWSPMTFLVKGEVEAKPQSLKQFLKEFGSEKLLLQDPEMSTPGLKWFYWFYKLGLLEGDSSPIHDIHLFPSWSTAYGQFKKRDDNAVFSFLTSLAYHLENDKEQKYSALQFKEGHPLQIDYAGVPNNCKSCKLGDRFVEFLLEKQSQQEILKKNYMFSVLPGLEQGTVYENLPQLPLIKMDQLDDFSAKKHQLIKYWKQQVK